MKRSYRIVAFVMVGLIGMSATIIKNDKLFEITKNLEIFATTYQLLNTKYVDELDPSELMKIGIDAMVNSLDPYTVYYSESQIESYRLADEGKYQGMGAIINKVGDYITVMEIYEDGPAMEAGLQSGDQIVEVNGLDTRGRSTEEMNAISKGVPGTDVNLKVKRLTSSSLIDITLTRGAHSIPNVPYSGRVADNIGYISLTTFTENASGNIINALQELKSDEELDGVILDLRYNGGGLLREAIAISNIFIDQGKEVVTTKGKIKEEDQTFNTMRPAIDLEIPIVVLTNKRSASASEIVSGVLQDYDRGVIMGQRTFGKGLVQNTQEVGYNSRVKLTTSKYYIPSRRCIQAVEYDNGEPVDIPDSQRSQFKTANGRVVLDGGGVTPDVRLPEIVQSEFTESLMKNNIIFQYVNKYVSEHEEVAAPGDFVFDEYNDFISFVQSNGYEFESEIEKELKEGSKDISSKLQLEFENLLAKINADQDDDLNEFKNQIIKEIELDIISRYYYQSGKAKHKLNGDSEIQEAISLLNDQDRYNKILGN